MITLQIRQELSHLRFLRIGNRSFCKSKDYDSSDDEKESIKGANSKPKPKEEQTESAASRLNRLLASMQKDESTFNKILTSQPGEANRKRKETAKQEAAAKDIFTAASKVASLLGGENKKQTESELLSKLLGRGQDTPSMKSTHQSSSKDDAQLSLSELIVRMKIDRRKQPSNESRAEFVRRTLSVKSQKGEKSHPLQREQRKREAEKYTGSVNLFGGSGLGIFKTDAQFNDSPDMLKTWAHLQERELKLQVSHPPANYFEKVARWTEQGKVWRFPIDNEQDLNEEADVDFSEHIFLEQHLEPWCPTKGPIRHFMELVCVGLSKNPYITAKEKKNHILWYRDYFEAKKDLLKDLIGKEIEKPSLPAAKQES